MIYYMPLGRIFPIVQSKSELKNTSHKDCYCVSIVSQILYAQYFPFLLERCNSFLGRLAPSLCISSSIKSDIHGIIMNPPDGGSYCLDEIQELVSAREVFPAMSFNKF